MRKFSIMLGALALAAPVAAQQAMPAQPAPMTGPSSDAALANDQVRADVASRRALIVPTPDMNAYDAEMAAYQGKMRAYWINRAATKDAAAQLDQANARAQEAWRMQVADCRHGDAVACRAPVLQPADFL